MLDSLNSNHVLPLLPFIWALVIAVVMNYWKSEHTEEDLIYQALIAIAMLLTINGQYP